MSNSVAFRNLRDGLIDRVINTVKKYVLILNAWKIKQWKLAKAVALTHNFMQRKTNFYEWKNRNYLGCYLNEKWDHSREIRIRIEKREARFAEWKRTYFAMLCSVLLYYGVEARILTDDATKCLKSFKLWCYRRMLRISFIYYVTNYTVIQWMNKDKGVLATIKKRKNVLFWTYN